MINLKEELKNFQKIDIESLEAKGTNLSINARNSIVLYNKALDSLNMGSEDIAIIELKKAISLNPEFYEAVNLLGICYSYVNDKSKAVEMFNRVIEAEKNSVMAMKYLDMLNEGETAHPDARKLKKKEKSFKEKFRINKNKNLSNIDSKKEVIRNALCFAAGALIVLVLCLIFMKGTGVSTKELEKIENEKNLLAQKNFELEEQYNKLNDDYNELQKNLEAANEYVDYYKIAIKLYEAESLFREGELEKAADMLLILKTVELEGDEKERFQTLYDKIMPQAAKKLFEEGTVLVNSSKKYSEALEKLNKIQMYTDNFEKMDAVLYYIGKCYQQMDDSRNALGTYQKLIEEYPNSSYVKWAKIRIDELTKLP
ncbi:MAG TPA: tetratricopeptide repeat protein [Clostridiaceae bacterium]|nr:tetratricopeptide repeat protein [Clostridiaceae bacterium]